jgi:tetratricopeptide (TPR) repeat protein
VDLADSYELTGEHDRAEEALQMGLRVRTYSPLMLWQAGNFYLMRNNLPRMYQCFKMACDYDPDKLPRAIRIAWTVDPDRAGIHERLIPNKLQARLMYLDFLVSQDELDLARPVWEASLRDSIPPRFDYKVNCAFAYIDRLLARNRIDEALQVWNEALEKAGLSFADQRLSRREKSLQPAGDNVNLVWNGSFERVPLGGGFDWHYSDAPGVQFAIDLVTPLEGLKSLKITFGSANLNLSQLWQIVPVPRAGAYQLEYSIKTQGLTTDQRPFFELAGYPQTNGVSARTEPFPPSSGWRNFELPFTVTEGTKAILLTLRRQPSNKFDNELQGTLWLDNISVRPVPAAAVSVQR